jgi:nucleotide-binding universal stress UspA family protein
MKHRSYDPIVFRQSTDRGESVQVSPSIRRQNASHGAILWAVDPMVNDPKRVRSLLASMNLWQSIYPSSVIPVSALAPINLDWPVELVASLRDKLFTVVQSSLLPVLKKVRPKESVEPRILIQKTSSRRQSVRSLLDFAEKEKVNLIAVNTRGHHGIRRLGSFAELLIALSPVPVLTVNPNTVVPNRVSSILFPTDFSARNKRVFKSVLDWAGKWNAKVILFHRLEIPYQPLMDPALTTSLYKGEKSEQRNRGTKWVAEAEKIGVKCEFVLSKSASDVDDLIVKTASSNKADLIVMPTYRGPIAQAVLGSVAREVLTSSQCPVIIVHTK